jgi:hypothetical protein
MLAAITLTASILIMTAAPAMGAGTGSESRLVAQLRTEIRNNRSTAVGRARWVGVLLRTGDAERHTTSVPYLVWMLHLWHGRANHYGRTLKHRLPVYYRLLCIHRHEGGWTSYSAAGPYYGGLQMDRSFESHYGRRFLARFGDARHWGPALQVAAAYRAVIAVGYSPWPVSRMACGV